MRAKRRRSRKVLPIIHLRKLSLRIYHVTTHNGSERVSLNEQYLMQIWVMEG